MTETHDSLLGGQLHLRQLPRGHRVGTDAILLAASLEMSSGLVLDVGAGVGAVGLALALRAPQIRLGLIERDPELAALARTNCALNGMEARAQVFEADVLSAKTRREAGLGDVRADAILTNPPYLDAASARLSPDPQRRAAHVVEGGLEAWARACAALLAPNGQLVMIHRADCLAEILTACTGRFGGLDILPIHPKAGAIAHRVLVRARLGSRAPLALHPPLILHGEDGKFTPLVEAIHRGQALVPFALR